MKRLLIQLPEELHQDLRELAHRHKASMSELVRRAIESVYEEELDGLMADREFDAYKADPSTAVTLDEFLAGRATRAISRSTPAESSKSGPSAVGIGTPGRCCQY